MSPATEIVECEECGGVMRVPPGLDVDVCVPCQANLADAYDATDGGDR